MKRFIVIMFIHVFLLSTAGLTLNKMYCNGSYVKVGIAIDACCKDLNKGGCCSSKTIVIKVKDFFESVSTVFLDFTSMPAVVYERLQHYWNTIILRPSFFKFYQGKAPPLNKVSLFLLYRSLII
jgi:hypothetical protein